MSRSPSHTADFAAEPYDFAAALDISESLGLRLPIATALVRRGLTSAEEVSALIEGEPENDPFLLSDMDTAVETIITAARAKERITVHGDYDADGVCATSILLGALEDIGADADWFLPDRREGGYGVSQTSIDEMAGRGTSLMITVDCGIGSREEIASLREAGISSVVTDHHERPDQLPECPVIHPARGDYPFPSLCGAAVAYKLASALRSEAGVESDSGIDLVALATVADLVPLVGENRTLVRRGLNRMRTSPRLGLRALMDAAGVSPESVDAGALGFRLAPRINAAGRLYRADAGVELMLCEDPVRAEEIGEELNRANSERRAVERDVMNGAESARRDLSEDARSAPALVLAGEGWHPGVVGIVASRLVEKYWRPVVLIAVEGGVGRGSGRSIPGFDLLDAISAGGDALNRFGGHKMAAGLEIDADRVDEFREMFVDAAVSRLGSEPPPRLSEVDAVIGAGEQGVDMELAQQLESLEPFGMGNPRPRFMVPAARLAGVRSMGREGKHASFDLCSGSGKVKGVGFGLLEEIERASDSAVDVEVQVEINRWNDSVEPRIVAREVQVVAALESGEGGEEGGSVPDWWTARFQSELEKRPGSRNVEVPVDLTGGLRREVDRRDSPVVPAVLDLASSRDSVLVVACDTHLRRGLVQAADPRRLGGVAPLIASGDVDDPLASGFVLADWDWVRTRPELISRFVHVAVIDPPPVPDALDLLRAGICDGAARGFLHLLWHTADLAAARAALEARWDPRPAAVEVWKVIEEAGGRVSADDLAQALFPGRLGRLPEAAARAVRALSEVDQLRVEHTDEDVYVELLEGGGRLDESQTYAESSEELTKLAAQLPVSATAPLDATAQAA